MKTDLKQSLNRAVDQLPHPSFRDIADQPVIKLEVMDRIAVQEENVHRKYSKQFYRYAVPVFLCLLLLLPGFGYVRSNLLVDGIVKAIRESDALKVYVCNVMTQEGETEGYTVSDHIAAIFAHSAQGLFRLCLTNSSPIPKAVAARYAEEGAERIRCDKSACAALGVEVVERPVATVESGFVRHSSAALARELILLHAERSVRIAGARFRPREDAYQMEERK